MTNIIKIRRNIIRLAFTVMLVTIAFGSSAMIETSYAASNWEKTGTGTSYYASFPAGYNTGSSLYSKYNNNVLSALQNDKNKREVTTVQDGWIYWHWTWRQGATNDGKYNFYIHDSSSGDESHASYPYFADFFSNESYSEYDPDGHHDSVAGLCFYHWRGNTNDGSWWWFRIPVYKQTYTDYKLNESGAASDISQTTVNAISNKSYTGKTIKPEPTVMNGSSKLVKGKDYTVKYKNNVKIGTATVIITGKGSYCGTISVNFKIVPKYTCITKTTAGRGKFTVKWKKVSKCTGYQICYSTNSDFYSCKFKTISSRKTTIRTISGLSYRKKYYFKIRSYTKSGGKTYYSRYCKVKTLTTKDIAHSAYNTVYTNALKIGNTVYCFAGGLNRITKVNLNAKKNRVKIFANFKKYGEALVNYSFSGGGTRCCSMMCRCGNYLYFVIQFGSYSDGPYRSVLYRKSLGGGNLEKLYISEDNCNFDDLIVDFKICNNRKLYLCEHNGEIYKYYRMDLNGKNKEEISAFDAPKVYKTNTNGKYKISSTRKQSGHDKYGDEIYTCADYLKYSGKKIRLGKWKENSIGCPLS